MQIRRTATGRSGFCTMAGLYWKAKAGFAPGLSLNCNSHLWLNGGMLRDVPVPVPAVLWPSHQGNGVPDDPDHEDGN